MLGNVSKDNFMEMLHLIFPIIPRNSISNIFLLAAPYGHGWGSWNVSHSKGPLGDICETDRSSIAFFYCDLIFAIPNLCLLYCKLLRDNWEGTVCYNSCPACDPTNSCEWTSCYDDVAYTMALLDKVRITNYVIKAQI